MKHDTNLFIGGHADGRRIENSGEQRIVVPIIPKFTAVDAGADVPLTPARHEEHVYERENLRCRNGAEDIDFVFYRFSNMPLHLAINSLFSHYRP